MCANTSCQGWGTCVKTKFLKLLSLGFTSLEGVNTGVAEMQCHNSSLQLCSENNYIYACQILSHHHSIWDSLAIPVLLWPLSSSFHHLLCLLLLPVPREEFRTIYTIEWWVMLVAHLIRIRITTGSFHIYTSIGICVMMRVYRNTQYI